MTDVDKLSERLQVIEAETRSEHKEVLQRLTRLETKIDMLGDQYTGTNQSRQQDRWSGALWIAGWGLVTGAVIAGVVVGFLRYLQ